MSCTNSFGEEQREEATISTAKFSKAGDLIERNSLETLSPEVLGLILDLLPAKTLLNLSETCRILHSECLDNGAIWKELFKVRMFGTIISGMFFQSPIQLQGPFGVAVRYSFPNGKCCPIGQH